MYFDTRLWCVLCALWSACEARGWAWPDGGGAESVRIDTKVRFLDDRPARAQDKGKRDDIQSDEVPFREPTETDGFYNRPPGAGRYRVRVEAHKAPYRVDSHAVFPVQTNQGNDGTLDSVQFCKCVSNPDCNPRPESAEACGPGRYLCCYKRPNGVKQQNTEFFNEIDDERPMLFPGKENIGGPFPPPPGSEFNGVFGPGHGHETVVLGSIDEQRESHPDALYGDVKRPVLVGPNGPTGHIGPGPQKPVLVGPDGPTGVIGPAPFRNKNIDSSETAQRGVLVGPGGPSGIIGPYNQRPVLTGPGGPTGVIGPGRGGARGVLVGPGGPTGVIGPGYGRFQGNRYGRQQGPGLLVGPGGPTGIIGPGRQLLVGPGGPTGHIGPQRYFESKNQTAAQNTTAQSVTEQLVHKDRTTVRNCSSQPCATSPREPCNLKKTLQGLRRFARGVPERKKQRQRSKCSRPDNSCGGSTGNQPRKPVFKKPAKRAGARQSGGNPPPKHIQTALESRKRAQHTHAFSKQKAKEELVYLPPTTVKPSVFRYVPHYVLLLKGLQMLLQLGII